MPAHFGLDIGSTSVKLIHIDGGMVKAIGIVNNTVGKNILDMSNAERLTLVESIKGLLKESGVRSKQVSASIPESLTYARVMKFPYMSTPELATAIKWELDQTVPFPPNEVEVSWVILEKPPRVTGEEKISVFVVAVPTKVSELYSNILDLVNLEPIRLENEIPPLVRSFGNVLFDSTPAIVLDIGAAGSNLVLAGKNNIFANFYLPIGGNAMTKFIADSFNLPVVQAESYKRAYGMSKDQIEGRMFLVLKPLVDNIVSELKKMSVAFQNEYGGRTVSRVIVTGGGSYLLGLIPYLSESLGNMEVILGDSLAEIKVPDKVKGLGPVFSVALGLAV